MILLVHMLFGAATASLVKNPIFAVVLAFLGHYSLDFIPHVEYDIKDIKEKRWHRAYPEIIKVFLDFLTGFLIIFTFSGNRSMIYICALTAVIPDGFTFLNIIFPNKILVLHDKIHRGKIHILKNKKISVFWRIISQVIIAVISITILNF